jgi:hypothetical protein
MPFLHQLAQGQVDLSLPIPVCDGCQSASKRRFRKAFWTAGMGFVLGVVGGFAVGGLIVIAVGGSFLVGGSISGFLGGLVSLLIGWSTAREAAQKAMPAQLERFLPKKGTVAIRFRRPEYAEQVLAANDGAPLQKASDDGPWLTTGCN